MKHKKLAIGFTIVYILVCVILTMKKGNLTSLNDSEKLGKTLGIVTLLPTLLTVILAFITHNVIFSLLIGFLTGSLISTIVKKGNLISFITISSKTFLDVTFDIDNITTLVLCLSIGALIELVKQAGGFEVIAKKLEKKINNACKANLMGVLLGCLIFFDDYANAMVLGPAMTRFGKRLKIAKEKIAYIVNSTSAPIAGTCLISTWAAVETSCISKGLQATNIIQDEFSMLKSSYGFTFYCMFTITFIIVGALLGKDFGPMYKKEVAARSKNKVFTFEIDNSVDNIQLLIGIASILILVISSLGLIFLSGRYNALREGILTQGFKINIENICACIACANSIEMIIIAILIALSFVIIVLLLSKIMSFKAILKALLKGLIKMLDTIAILLLAWSLAEIMKQIGTVYYSVELISMNVNWKLIPTLLLLCCCIISSASGSYGTMFVVMPLALPLCEKMINVGINIEPNNYLYLVIGSVICGSIFGDACSPISDCVTLTSESVDVSPINIVETTIIYSIINILISILAIMLVIMGYSRYIALLIGVIIQIIIYFIFGKKIKER